MQGVQLTRIHRILIAVVVAGAVVIAAIGFAGSFAAVRDLAEKKGFGAFSPFFPIGVDAGIVVLLALDLLLTWIRIPFPLLRQTAWLLTAATIAFNGAAAWPDPLGVGMHAVIPVLFVVTVEAARHATGRVADITADRHMEGVRVSRWLLAFPSTFRLWRRMKLWELRSYDEVIRMEQDRLVYEARLHARYGRGWRRKAPVESLMPLKLARYGIPLAETAPSGLAAAGLAPTALAGSPHRELAPAASTPGTEAGSAAPGAGTGTGTGAEAAPTPAPGPREARQHPEQPEPGPAPQLETQPASEPQPTRRTAQQPVPQQEPAPEQHVAAPEPEPPAQSPQSPTLPDPVQEPEQVSAPPAPAYAAETTAPAPRVTVPVTPGRHRTLAEPVAEQEPLPDPAPDPAPAPEPARRQEPQPQPSPEPDDSELRDEPVGIPDGVPREEMYFETYRQYIASHGSRPSARQLSRALHEGFGVMSADGTLLSEKYLGTYMREFRERYNTEMGLAG